MKKILSFLLLPLICNAQSTEVIDYISEEPATLLDIGMMRLQTLAIEFTERVGLYWTSGEELVFFNAGINATYEPTDQKFYVSLSAMDSRPTDLQMTEACRNSMSQMNIWLLKSLPGLFTHTGAPDPSAPPDMFRSLANRFELRCYFSSGRDSSDGRFWASRRLTVLGDDEMKIGKWKMSNE